AGMRNRVCWRARSWCPPDTETVDLVGQRCDLARGQTVIVDLGCESAGLRGVGEDDALADGGCEERWIVVGQSLGRLAGDDGARAATVQNEPGGQFGPVDARLSEKRQHFGG